MLLSSCTIGVCLSIPTIVYQIFDSFTKHIVKVVSRKLGMYILNLTSRTISKEEVLDASLEGLYEDSDLTLITPSSITRLR